jgi:hypothetical protein
LKRVALYAGAGLVVLGLLALIAYASAPALGRWYVRTRVIPRWEKRLGRSIHVDKILMTRGHVELIGVRVAGTADGDQPLLQVARVAADFDFWKAARGDLRIGEVVVERPRAALVVQPDGKDNWSDLGDRLRHKGAKPASATAQKKTRFVRAVLMHGGATFEDRAHHVKATVEDMTGFYEPHGQVELKITTIAATTKLGPSAGVDAIALHASGEDVRGTLRVDVDNGRVALYQALSLSGVRGSIAPAEQGGGKELINLEGGYAGVDGTLWHAQGWLDQKSHTGEFHLKADKFTFDKLAPVLKDTMVRSPEKTALSASLDLTLDGDTLGYDGHVELFGLTVYHPWLADQPVKDLGFAGEIKGSYHQGARVFDLDSASVQFRGIEARIEAYVSLPGGHDKEGVPRAKPRLRARLIVPTVPCAKALKALPRELTPKLQGFRLTGNFKTDVAIDIDWSNLEALELGGSVGINGCKVIEPRKEMDAELLEAEFEHHVEVEKDHWVKFMVGPSNPDFVPIADVSPYLINSLLTTEDYLFYQHHGFIIPEFRTALIKNLEAGYFRVGASSITMQFVKNVLLYKQKTIARKLQELFLTWYVEQNLEKDRILEIYLNVIEFGPNIYGIGPAAHAYFGKPAKDLNAVEAAWFSTILPNPKRRYLQYCDAKVARWTEEKIKRILKLEHERDKLTDEEYDRYKDKPLDFMPFAYPPGFDARKCEKDTNKIIKNSRKTTPEADEEFDKDAP